LIQRNFILGTFGYNVQRLKIGVSVITHWILSVSHTYSAGKVHWNDGWSRCNTSGM